MNTARTHWLFLRDRRMGQSWKNEIRRRLAEMKNGTVQPIPGEAVSARIRKIIGR